MCRRLSDRAQLNCSLFLKVAVAVAVRDSVPHVYEHTAYPVYQVGAFYIAVIFSCVM